MGVLGRSSAAGACAITALLAIACTFDRSGGSGAQADASSGDTDSGGPNGMRDGPASDATCAFAMVDVCGQPAAGGSLEIDGERTLDTDIDPLCRPHAQVSGGPEACLVYVGGLSIAPNGRLTAVGSRPLLIVSLGDILIDGMLDVGSTRSGRVGAGADFDDCSPFLADPENDAGGGGGGAGGSFRALGGDGGTGNTDQSGGTGTSADPGRAGSSAAQPGFVRGGCAGQEGGASSTASGGDGGASGGAVLLAASGQIAIGGDVRAVGAGGTGGTSNAGAGGAGSGGMIALEADPVVITGVVSANGGGGGEGGVRFQNGNVITGDSGDDGQQSSVAASGGSGTSSFSGNGGAGAAGESMNGGSGGAQVAGAGGGGGGAGFILIFGSLAGADGVISPSAVID